MFVLEEAEGGVVLVVLVGLGGDGFVVFFLEVGEGVLEGGDCEFSGLITGMEQGPCVEKGGYVGEEYEKEEEACVAEAPARAASWGMMWLGISVVVDLGGGACGDH